MVRLVVLILAIISLGNVNNSLCAQAAWKSSEDCMDIVAQETQFPTVISQLVAGYVGYRVKKTLPAQESACVEHVMSDGSLLCVPREGQITVRNLMTNKVLQSLWRYEKLAVVSQLPSSPDDRLSALNLIMHAIVRGKEGWDVVDLADGDTAVRKRLSGEVEIIYADRFREALPLGKEAHSLQDLSNGDLFVKYADGTKSLVTKDFVPPQGFFLELVETTNAFSLVK